MVSTVVAIWYIDSISFQKLFIDNSKFHRYIFLEQVMSCHLHKLDWSSSPQMSSMWLKGLLTFLLTPTNCGGSTLQKLHFPLHWIHFSKAPPSSPSTPNPDSSFLLGIMSIICLLLAWAVQEFQYLSHVKEKYFLSIIIYCSHSTPRGARGILLA